MSGTEPEPDTSISHLTDLPAPILDHIVSFLDSAWDRKQLRKVARALVEPAERAATSLTLTRGNLARLWPGRFPACRHVAVTLSVASSFIDAPVAAAWLCDLPALESVEVTFYIRQTDVVAPLETLACAASPPRLRASSPAQTPPLTEDTQAAAVHSAFQWMVSALPADVPVSVALHIEHNPGQMRDGSEAARFARISRALCAAVGECRPACALGLTALPGGVTQTDLALIPDLGRVTQLHGLRVLMHDPSTLSLLTQLSGLVKLQLSCRYLIDEGASTPQEQHTESHLPSSLTQCSTSLTHITLADYMGDPIALLEALVSLPCLEHLALAGLGWSHGPVSAPHLHILATYPALTSLAVDKLCLTRDSPTLHNIYSLDVGLSVTGELRLPHVLPSLERAELKWLWEGALTKVAGLQSLTTLTLGQLGYGADWGLLRTLTALQDLRFCHGTGRPLFSTLLHTTAELHSVTRLSLIGWYVPTRATSKPGLQQSTMETQSATAATDSNAAGSEAVCGLCTEGACALEPAGAGQSARATAQAAASASDAHTSTGNGACSPSQAGGVQTHTSDTVPSQSTASTSVTIHSPVLHNSDSNAPSRSISGLAQHNADTAQNPGRHSNAPSQSISGLAPQHNADADQIASVIASLAHIQRLDIVACTATVLDALHMCVVAYGGLQSLKELRLSQLPHLCASTVVDVVCGLRALQRLELGACGGAGEACFRGGVLRAIEDNVCVVWDENEDAAHGQ